MSTTDHTIQVPSGTFELPYDIGEPVAGRYIRIRRSGCDVLYLVPPGADADEHRAVLGRSIWAAARGRTRSIASDRVLAVLVFLVLPALLLILTSIFVARNGAHSALPGAGALVLFMAAILAMLWPRHGAMDHLLSVQYPADPEVILREAPVSGFMRYVTEADFAGSTALQSLLHAILHRPETVSDDVWSTLWIYAADDHLHPVASAYLRTLAGEHEQVTLDTTAEEFSIELGVARGDMAAAEHDQPDPSVPEPDVDLFRTGIPTLRAESVV